MTDIDPDECPEGCDLRPYIWEPVVGPLKDLAWPREEGHVGTVGGAFLPVPHRFRFICLRCRRERWLSLPEAAARNAVVFSFDEDPDGS